jgi:hypothetical protein
VFYSFGTNLIHKGLLPRLCLQFPAVVVNTVVLNVTESTPVATVNGYMYEETPVLWHTVYGFVSVCCAWLTVFLVMTLDGRMF